MTDRWARVVRCAAMMVGLAAIAGMAGRAVANPYATGGLLGGGEAPAAREGEDPFTWVATPLRATVGERTRAVVTLKVPTNHHVYRDQLSVMALGPEGLVVGHADLPPGVRGADPADPDDVRELYDRDVVIYVPVTARRAGAFTVRLQVRHQGCRVGLCHPPVESSFTLPVTAVPPEKG